MPFSSIGYLTSVRWYGLKAGESSANWIRVGHGGLKAMRGEEDTIGPATTADTGAVCSGCDRVGESYQSGADDAARLDRPTPAVK